MNPALSVIFFTTLSGAGYGLLIWSALAALGGELPARPLLAAVALALLLATVGLLSSFAHLGKPLRAWRAYSQWRTSWLSREGVAATLTYVPALALAMALLPGMLDGSGTGSVALSVAGMAASVALIAGALATIVCTAMIYASLKPIPAWRHRLVVPVYLGFALLCGGLLLAAIVACWGWPVGRVAHLALAALAVVLGLLKLRYWRDIDATPVPATRGDAVGLPGRKVTVFERPNTEANYITREMAFVVARRHVRRLRALSIMLFAALPVTCAWLFVDAGWWLAAAALCALAGAFVERWLFFAEAKHMVTLYYL